MECPICKNSHHVEIDTHSDGYAENLQECGHCGALWTFEKNKDVLIHGSTLPLAING